MKLDFKKNRTLAGIVKRHPDGFGFFVADQKDVPDVYIPKQFMQGVMSNDRVEINIYPEPGGNRFRGEITKVLQRAFTRVIGKFQNLNDQHAILMDDKNNWGTNLTIPKAQWLNAKNNDLVVVDITGYASGKEPLTGKVIEVLGDANDPLFDIKKVIINHKIPNVFSDAVLEESKHFGLEPNPQDFKHRRDLTKMKLITIDGKTAKDFDDAIYIETTHQGFHLIVAIADVSHYVKVDSAIDKEAYERGTSVYFPNFVVPMLPEALSNELCSLKPNVHRLCLVADMQMDFKGNVIKSEFYEAIMKSQARVTYGEAQEIIEGNCPEQFTHVKDMILKAADLAKILMARRFQNGSLDLEIPETELIIDESGQPVDVIRSERIFAHRLIEEMMLSANVAVAHFIGQHETPVLYRIHEPPKADNIELLNSFLSTFGSSRQLSPHHLQKDISKALEEFKGKPEEIILHILTLRSMNQAKYSPDNVGHFGLGFDEYCHFTSPIRRYPDLIVHRVLKNVIGVDGYEIASEETLGTAGTFLSACEQRSVKSERQLHSIKKARFMNKYLGQEFEGIISSVAKFGIFVLLRQYDVDGLVKIENLGDDHFMFIEEELKLRGKRSGKEYSIGDLIKIQVARCDVEAGQIDFVIPDIVPAVRDFKKGNKRDFGRKNFEKRPNRDNKKDDRRRDQNRNNNFGAQAVKSGGGPGGRREEILRMLDQKIISGDFRGNAKKRSENENDRGGSRKARLSKRPRKGKTR